MQSEVITTFDLMKDLKCSQKKAQEIIRDIKKEEKARYVQKKPLTILKRHYNAYFGIITT